MMYEAMMTCADLCSRTLPDVRVRYKDSDSGIQSIWEPTA